MAKPPASHKSLLWTLFGWFHNIIPFTLSRGGHSLAISNQVRGGIKSKCKVHIMKPHVKKIAKILKIGRVIAVFVCHTTNERIFENIFFRT